MGKAKRQMAAKRTFALKRLIAAAAAFLVLLMLPTGCAQKQEPPEPGLTYAELLAAAVQTSEGGIGSYIDFADCWTVT